MEKIENQENFLEIARQNFDAWNAALQTKDAKKVAELYAEDNTFLPTVSPEFKSGQTEAEGYFEHFLEKDPAGKIVKEKVQPLGNGMYLHSGLYNFEVGPEDKREVVEARFTFLWQKDKNGKWEILHHHSSAKPQTH